MDVRDFDFHLPPELIAQTPHPERTDARMLCLERPTGAITHRVISDLPQILGRGDLLVVNNTRVFPARLLGRRAPSGGAVECLLVKRLVSETGVGEGVGDGVGEGVGDGVGDRGRADAGRTDVAEWEALMHPGQKLKPGARVLFEGDKTLHGEVLERMYFGRRRIRLWTEDGSDVDEVVDAIGHVPLPPYIKRGDRTADRDRYQTVFARTRGSVAAPTAGLHFTPPLIAALHDRGIDLAEITLHVGYGTFQPVRVDRVENHRLDAEYYDVDREAAEKINAAMRDGRRVVAVGTTTTRTLEAVAQRNGGAIVAGRGWCDLFIYPGFEFRVLGALLTNFHLPRSSLLMLVAAFAGLEPVLHAYQEAIAVGYRFYSYGDAMLIL